MAKQVRKLTIRAAAVTAYHEAGHAVAAWVLMRSSLRSQRTLHGTMLQWVRPPTGRQWPRRTRHDIMARSRWLGPRLEIPRAIGNGCHRGRAFNRDGGAFFVGRFAHSCLTRQPQDGAA
jgi:hypothetical protein